MKNLFVKLTLLYTNGEVRGIEYINMIYIREFVVHKNGSILYEKGFWGSRIFVRETPDDILNILNGILND